MRKSWWLLLAVTGALAVWVGCERSPSGKKAITLEPTGEAPVRVATTVPSPAPTTSKTTEPQAEKKVWMSINGAAVDFPEAKLVVKKVDDHVLAFLSSKDPPEVLSPKYRGNRYYFELKLDSIDTPAQIAQAQFHYKASSAEPADTPNGIFLDGDREHLQPYDIFVVFDREGDQVIAEIQGQFLHFPKGQLVGNMIPVAASFPAKIVSK